MRRTTLCLLIFAIGVHIGCGPRETTVEKVNATTPQLKGTYALDSDATMAFLRSEWKDDQKKMAQLHELFSKPMQVTYFEDHKTIELDETTTQQAFQIVETGANHVVIKTELGSMDAAILSEQSYQQRIEFTDDGFWIQDPSHPKIKEKYVKQKITSP